MPQRARYLIVDGHSVIFAWPELRKLHARRSSSAREALIKQLRDYQDWTGVRVVVVFDGKGSFELMVATSDSMEAETVAACGAEWISPEALRGLVSSTRRN
ncbi:MAG: hypothetical protein DME55_01760 [Verrucomicrobia bacterium]|nr:MAG: hypothetical protein DME55_01760 [Verrucomicrobiota bacterium]